MAGDVGVFVEVPDGLGSAWVNVAHLASVRVDAFGSDWVVEWVSPDGATLARSLDLGEIEARDVVEDFFHRVALAVRRAEDETAKAATS